MQPVRVQVREEEEEEAIAAIQRCKRDGDVSLDAEEIKIMEARFTRLGKEKAYSGQQYQEMTQRVILNGTAANSVSGGLRRWGPRNVSSNGATPC
jgi:hypothetical protein